MVRGGRQPETPQNRKALPVVVRLLDLDQSNVTKNPWEHILFVIKQIKITLDRSQK